jgi:transcription factor E2F3
MFDDLYSKNIIEDEDETKMLTKELELINSQENEIDKCLMESKKYFDSVSENQNFKEFGYVTYEDIKSLTKGEDVNLIAIKAPSGTSLDIPDPNHITKIYNEVQRVINFI